MLLPSKLIMENPLKWQKEAHAVYPSTVKKTKASNPLMNNSKTSKSLSAQNAHASAYSKFDKKSKNAFGVSFSIFQDNVFCFHSLPKVILIMLIIFNQRLAVHATDPEILMYLPMHCVVICPCLMRSYISE